MLACFTIDYASEMNKFMTPILANTEAQKEFQPIVCAAITLVQSEQSLSIKNDQKQDVLPTKDMEKHSSGQNKNEKRGIYECLLCSTSPQHGNRM